jgi:hypothetical protein
LSVLIGFLSPTDNEPPILPLSQNQTSEEEYRPFSRQVSEFKFWCVFLVSSHP